jgi:hypothetical protein
MRNNVVKNLYNKSVVILPGEKTAFVDGEELIDQLQIGQKRTTLSAEGQRDGSEQFRENIITHIWFWVMQILILSGYIRRFPAVIM